MRITNILFGVLVFLLNFFWESWHGAYLYEGYYGAGPGSLNSLKGFVALITYASFVDMVLLMVIVLGGVLVWRDQWWSNMDKNKYAYFVIAAVTIAVIIEVKAIHIFGEWAYNSSMPTLFGLGLSPLLQLAATGLVALGLTRCLLLSKINGEENTKGGD